MDAPDIVTEDHQCWGHACAVNIAAHINIHKALTTPIHQTLNHMEKEHGMKSGFREMFRSAHSLNQQHILMHHSAGMSIKIGSDVHKGYGPRYGGMRAALTEEIGAGDVPGGTVDTQMQTLWGPTYAHVNNVKGYHALRSHLSIGHGVYGAQGTTRDLQDSHARKHGMVNSKTKTESCA